MKNHPGNVRSPIIFYRGAWKFNHHHQQQQQQSRYHDFSSWLSLLCEHTRPHKAKKSAMQVLLLQHRRISSFNEKQKKGKKQKHANRNLIIAMPFEKSLQWWRMRMSGIAYSCDKRLENKSYSCNDKRTSQQSESITNCEKSTTEWKKLYAHRIYRKSLICKGKEANLGTVCQSC